MPTTPTLQDEVAYIGGVKTDGSLAQTAYWGWDRNTPAAYSSGWTTARKWGSASAGSAGGTVNYYFDPASNWTATEKTQFAASLAMWSAVANISFVQTTTASQAQITLTRGHDGGAWSSAAYSVASGACRTGGTTLATLTSATVSIDTGVAGFGPINGCFSAYGGYPIETVLHELGHALGLGHAGPYNGDVSVGTQQYSAYDTRQWTIMSYIQPETTGAKYYSQYTDKANYGGNVPTTWMPLDILAIQQLYGVAVSTPLSGGQTFGFNCNITGSIEPYFDFTKNTKPIITIWDKGTGNTLDLSGFTGKSTINLTPGTFSSTSGLTDNIAIAFGTSVDTLVCNAGGATVTCNADGDKVYGGNGADTFIVGAGNDILYGGGGNDTTVFSGNYATYTITNNADGSITVTGSSGTDTLASIEALVFADRTVTPTSVTPAPVPTVKMPAPTDFNADGKSEILLNNPVTNVAQIWSMNGTTKSSGASYYGPSQGWITAGTGDFSADGKADILWQNTVTGQMKLWEMNGTAKLSALAVGSNPGAGWKVMAIGDFNLDGKADIVFQNGDQVAVWLMDRTTKLSGSTFAAPSGFAVIGAGDFDADGNDDILLQNTSSSALEIWSMKAGQPDSQVILAANPGSGWRAAGIGDFNADGKSDILLQNTNGQVAVWMMDGTTKLTSSGTVTKNLGTVWKAMGTGDYNGDGTADILFQNAGTGQIYIEFMSGTSVLSGSGTLYANPGKGWNAVTG